MRIVVALGSTRVGLAAIGAAALVAACGASFSDAPGRDDAGADADAGAASSVGHVADSGTSDATVDATLAEDAGPTMDGSSFVQMDSSLTDAGCGSACPPTFVAASTTAVSELVANDEAIAWIDTAAGGSAQVSYLSLIPPSVTDGGADAAVPTVQGAAGAIDVALSTVAVYVARNTGDQPGALYEFPLGVGVSRSVFPFTRLNSVAVIGSTVYTSNGIVYTFDTMLGNQGSVNGLDTGGPFTDLRASAHRLFFFANGSLQSCVPTACTGNKDILSTSAVAGAYTVDAYDHVYWVVNGSLHGCAASTGTCNASVIASVGLVTGLAADPHHVYWLDTVAHALYTARIDDVTVDGGVLSDGGGPPIAVGAPIAIAQVTEAASGLAVNASSVFWSDGAGGSPTISSVPRIQP